MKIFGSINKWVVSHAKKLDVSGLPLFVVYLVLLYAAASFFLFIIAWVCKWLLGHSPDLQVYIEYLKVLTAPQTVAFVAFILKMLIDKDSNGIPDAAEKELEENDK